MQKAGRHHHKSKSLRHGLWLSSPDTLVPVSSMIRDKGVTCVSGHFIVRDDCRRKRASKRALCTLTDNLLSDGQLAPPEWAPEVEIGEGPALPCLP